MSGTVIIQMVKNMELSGKPGRSWPDGSKTFLQWVREHLHLFTELVKTQKLIVKNMTCVRVGEEHHVNLQYMKCLPTYGG